jgi:putative redox protein
MSEDWTRISANWVGGLNFLGENQTNGTVQMGTSDTLSVITPMQILLIGLAGCTGMDIVSILQKKRIELDRFQIEVEARKADLFPKIWTNIHVKYLFWGKSIKNSDVEQAIKLSEDKYCSVSIMLGKSAEIKSSYQINLSAER